MPIFAPPRTDFSIVWNALLTKGPYLEEWPIVGAIFECRVCAHMPPGGIFFGSGACCGHFFLEKKVVRNV